MPYRSVTRIIALIGIVWLFVETGKWISNLMHLDTNGLFWPFWILVWLTLILGAICFDYWRQNRKEKSQSQRQKV